MKSVVVNVDQDQPQKAKFGKRPLELVLLDAILWIAMTAYLIAVIALNSTGKDGFPLLVVIYLFISLRLLARHVSMSQTVYEPLGKIFDKVPKPSSKNTTTIALFIITFVGLVVGAFSFQSSGNSTLGSRLQSILGIFCLIGFLTLFSRDRKNIPWYTVASGLFIQYLIALFVLKSSLGQSIFGYLSKFIGDFLNFAKSGLEFIIGTKYTPNFATGVLPAIVFFCSFIAIVYYYGGMQYLVAKLAWVFVRIMDTSGAESAVACASPFVGQGESALLVGPFVPFMTKSELHSTMVSGFATIAGSVLSFYLTLVKDPKTILCCCIMSIPAGLLLSKIRYPEDEESISKGQVKIPPSSERDVNFLHAATKGSATGMTLIILISGSLLAIVSLYTAADTLVGWLFGMLTITDWVHPGLPVTIELLLSYIFAPVAWLIGVSWSEARQAGELMATKMVVNEFVAYDLLSKATLSARTQDLMAFALCGFANFASVGIQIGALGAIAPSRTEDLALLAVSAMLTGTMATWLCAMMAGALI